MDMPEGWLFLTGKFMEIAAPDGSLTFAPAVGVPTRYGKFGTVRLGTKTYTDFREALSHASRKAAEINLRIERTLQEVE